MTVGKSGFEFHLIPHFWIVTVLMLCCPLRAQDLSLPAQLKLGTYGFYSEHLDGESYHGKRRYRATHAYDLTVGNSTQRRIDILNVHAISEVCLKLRTGHSRDEYLSLPSLAAGEQKSLRLYFDAACEQTDIVNDSLVIEYTVEGDANIRRQIHSFSIEFESKRPFFLGAARADRQTACPGDSLFDFSLRLFAARTALNTIVLDSIRLPESEGAARITHFRHCGSDKDSAFALPALLEPRRCLDLMFSIRQSLAEGRAVPITIYAHYEAIPGSAIIFSDSIRHHPPPVAKPVLAGLSGILKSTQWVSGTAGSIILRTCDTQATMYLDSITRRLGLQEDDFEFRLPQDSQLPWLIDFGAGAGTSSLNIDIVGTGRQEGEKGGYFELHMRDGKDAVVKRYVYAQHLVHPPLTVPVEPPEALHVYPNPARDKLNVCLIGNTRPETPRYSLFNYLGQRLMTAEPPFVCDSFEIGRLAPGVYFLRMERGDNVIARPFSIVR